MQRFDGQIFADSAEPTRFGVQESPDLHDTEPQDPDDSALTSEESTEERTDSSDDPVRVYLREMGSVSLLTRQGELALAQRMERGSLRFQKALSRSPLVRKMALAMYQEIRAGKVRLEDVVHLSSADDAAKRRARIKAVRQFEKVAELDRELSRLGKQFA